MKMGIRSDFDTLMVLGYQKLVKNSYTAILVQIRGIFLMITEREFGDWRSKLVINRN